MVNLVDNRDNYGKKGLWVQGRRKDGVIGATTPDPAPWT